MRRLCVEQMGEVVQGVRLRGDPRNPEPMHFRVVLPFGDVDVARCSDGSYWVHVRIDEGEGAVTDGRVDLRGRHATECDAGDLGHPDLYHLAVRVGPKEEE